MIKNKPLSIAVHVLCWLLVLSLIVSFITTSGDTTVFAAISSSQFVFFALVFIALFYLNGYLLIPLLYFKKRYLLYVFISLVMLMAIASVKPFDQLMNRQQPLLDGQPAPANGMRPTPPPRGEPGRFPPPKTRLTKPSHIDIISLILFLMIYSLGWAMQLVKKWRRVEERALRAEADKAQAELAFLKAQLNPHFLFNTLNSIYALAVSNNEKTAASIMKLSKIMRYVTDEVGADFVELENEISFITDYIDLQKMRLSSMCTVEFLVTGPVEEKLIAPLLLMPFIENVFKYGTSNHQPSVIHIQLSTDDKQLRFFCRNRIFSRNELTERTGIGVHNTKQRLQQLYPGKHSLSLSAVDHFYTVELSLQL